MASIVIDYILPIIDRIIDSGCRSYLLSVTLYRMETLFINQPVGEGHLHSGSQYL